ncbi:ABC transporter ATP-binding protein [Halobacterium yunchengense]|uniref:ABC transporter ATP-binding protein n=1 Tax=Halobacterium yunchengense TaxID=3108497 RepID=UPI0030083F52
MAELQLDHITKTFDDGGDEIVAVDDVSIDIEDGEFLVLVGPSGCGKSTTLRTIAGLETVTDGEIRLGGEVINDKRPQDRNTAMVFQSYALYPHMTVRENMSFGLEESTDMPDDEVEKRVTEAAEMMGIADLLDRKPGELSGGQQQRVALGRAIVRDPQAFLMDEPLANLDAKLRAQMRTELQRLQEDLGVTTIYVTHDQTEAMTMGDRIAILDDGELQQVGTPLECYHEPANLFVAGFIGEPSMNTFEARVDGDRLVADHFAFELTDRHREAIGDADRVVFGIRPEDVEVGTTADDHTYDVTVDVVEPKGDENYVHMRFEGAGEDETFTATIDGLRQATAGDDVTVRFPPEAVHVFDAKTGDALLNRSLEDAEGVELVL